MSTQTSPLPPTSAAPPPRGRSPVAFLLAALLLVSACSDDPSAPAAGSTPDPTPELPVAPVSDAAALISADQGDVEFTELTPPHRLVLPSGTVTVNAVAQVPELTRTMASALSGRSDLADAERFAPADGQTIHLWRIAIGAPPVMAVHHDPLFSAPGPVQDPSGTVELHAGGDAVPLTSMHGEADITFECDDIPCGGAENEPSVLVASLDASADPALVAVVDGHELTLDLSSGEVTSDVSTVAQDRPDTAYPASIDWPLTRYVVRTEEQVEADTGVGLADSAEVVYRGHFDEMFLAPFDRARGWAPPGSAWLVIPIEAAFERNTRGWGVEIDHASSWTLSYDDDSVTPAEPHDAPNHPVFLVSDDISAATLTYRPAGTISTRYPAAEYPFEVDEPLVAELTFD